MASCNNSEENSKITSAQLQEFNDLLKSYKAVKEKYRKTKLLFDAVEETVEQPSFDPKLKAKVQDITLGHRCVRAASLESDGFSIKSKNLLGLNVKDLTSGTLNYEEGVILKDALKETLENKHKNICDEFLNATGEDLSNVASICTEFGTLHLTSDEQALFELKKKLQDEQRRYLRNLLDEQRVLEDMLKLKLEKLPEVCENKVGECEIKSRIAELQVKIVQEKARIDVFMEGDNSLEAYEALMKDIEQQQGECQVEIQHLTKLKEKYAQVDSKEFKNILKEYIQYKSALAKKKMIYETLQKSRVCKK